MGMVNAPVKTRNATLWMCAHLDGDMDPQRVEAMARSLSRIALALRVVKEVPGVEADWECHDGYLDYLFRGSPASVHNLVGLLMDRGVKIGEFGTIDVPTREDAFLFEALSDHLVVEVEEDG